LDGNDLDVAVAKTVKAVRGMKKVKEISKAKKWIDSDSLCLFFYSLKQPIKFINNSLVRE
jgi:hypothetical protein